MPAEELEFKARLFLEKELVGLDPVRRVRKGDREYLLEVRFHHGRKEWFVDVNYLDYSKLEFEGTKYERPSEWGGPGECFSKTIAGVIDCVEQNYNVKVKITGITPEELKRQEQLILEEAVAPKPREISFFDVIESNSEKVLEGMKKDIPMFCNRSTIGVALGSEEAIQHGENVCRETLEWLAGEIELEVENEDWNSDLKYGRHLFSQGPVNEAEGRMVVRAKLKELLDRAVESAEYLAEKDWGVEPKEPYKMGQKDKAEQLAERLIDVFKGGQREYFNSLGTEDQRRAEAEKEKRLVREFVRTYVASMRRRVEQLR